MLLPFPYGSNYDEPCYWANHNFSMLIACGCTLGDAEFASAPALTIAHAGQAVASTGGPSEAFQHAFAEGYLAAASRLETQAQKDVALGRIRTAGAKFLRASVLYELLDWNYWPFGNLDRGDPGEYFRRGRAAFKQGIDMAGGRHAGITWTTVPFEGHDLEAMFVPARRADGGIAKQPAPVVLHVNGQHSSLQWQYCFGLSAALAERGIASFHFDHPGTGDARYNKRLGARPDSESYGSAAIDQLVSRDDVDENRIGIIGGSFGSYRGPRIASFDSRVKSVVAWSTQYDLSVDFGDLSARLLNNGAVTEEDSKLLDQLYFWTQTSSIEELRELWQKWTLSGHLANLTASIACVRGENDGMPQLMADRMLREAVNAPRREMLLTTHVTGGTEHCHWDDPAYALGQIVDFTAEVLRI